MTRRTVNLASGASTLRAPDLGTHLSTLITSAGIGTAQASRKASRTNFVTRLEPGSGELDGGRTTSRACTNSAGSVPATFTPGEASRGFSVWSSPRVGINFDVASGDRNRSSPNLGTFNAFFQSGTYSGRAQLLGPSNSIRLEPTLTLAPRPNVSVSTGWGFYWRESVQDGLYGIPGNLIVPSNGVPGHYEGSRPIVEVAWRLNPHLSMHLNYTFVFNGRFEERSIHATTTESYICPWITYRF